MHRLDHIMYAVPDLDAGVKAIAAQLGVQPVAGGAHPGQGTHNALLSLGDGQYLEIIAPDPAQPLAGTLGEEIRDARMSCVRTWAVATDDLDAVQRTAQTLGFTARRVAMSRATPAGPTLNWELMFVSGHPFGELFPFFIDWLESPHPSATTIQGGMLESFTISTSDPDAFAGLMAAFDVGQIEVIEGPDGLAAEIRTPDDDIRLL